VETPDGHGRLELTKFHAPSGRGGDRHAQRYRSRRRSHRCKSVRVNRLSIGRWLAVLFGLLVLAALALVAEARTGSEIVGWIAIGLVGAVFVVRFIIWLRAA